jgi:hypothetical protein
LDLAKLIIYHRSLPTPFNKPINKKAKDKVNIKKITTYIRLQTDTANQAYRQETEESVEEEFKQQILQKKTRTMEVFCKV